MLCQNCGKNEATTHIKRVVNGDTTETHLCAECAQHLGYGDMFSGFGLNLDDFFGSFLGDSGAKMPQMRLHLRRYSKQRQNRLQRVLQNLLR